MWKDLRQDDIIHQTQIPQIYRASLNHFKFSFYQHDSLSLIKRSTFMYIIASFVEQLNQNIMTIYFQLAFNTWAIFGWLGKRVNVLYKCSLKSLFNFSLFFFLQRQDKNCQFPVTPGYSCIFQNFRFFGILTKSNHKSVKHHYRIEYVRWRKLRKS